MAKHSNRELCVEAISLGATDANKTRMVILYKIRLGISYPI